MNRDDDQFWQAASATEEPTVAELAQAEAQLAELPPMGPLGDAEIARLMARVVPPVIRAKRLHPLRRLLLAACSITVVALVWDLWPERRFSAVNLNYPRAVRLTTAEGYTDTECISAFIVIGSRTQYADQIIRELSGDSIEAISTEAQRARQRLLELVQTSSDRGPGQVDDGMEVAALAAMAKDMPIGVRLLALAHVEHLAAEGIRAILSKSMQTEAGESTRTLFRQRLDDMLSQ